MSESRTHHGQYPRHLHDCDGCIFLGQFEDYDFWWHRSVSMPSLDSVLVRYGSEGHEYKSYHPPEAFAEGGGEMLKKRHPYYREILKRAQAQKLYMPVTKGGTL